MKAYVTTSNAKSIVYKLDVDEIDIHEEIYKIDFKWFNSYEVKSLLAFKLLFQKPEEFFKKYKRKKAFDTKEFIFEGKFPSHHNSSDCDHLLSNFFNYKIPDEIKDKGDEAIEYFRNWFKEHMHLIEGNMELFIDRMKWRFGLEERPKIVDYKNSGAEILENLDLPTLEKRIEILIKDVNSFYQLRSMNKIVLDNFGRNSFIWKEKKAPFKNNTNYSNEEIWTVLKEFEEIYKIPLATLLREYYRVKFNPELQFEGQLLEQLGFKPCRNCYDKEYLTNFNNANEDDETDRKNIKSEFKPSSYNKSKIVINQISIRLYESEEFSIFTDFSRFKSYMERCLLTYPHLTDDKKLLELMEYEVSTADKVIDIISLSNKFQLNSRSKFRVAGLLEEGLCLVFNNIKGTLVNAIEVQEYGYQIGELCGHGGRIFLADGIEFFKTQDWIS